MSKQLHIFKSGTHTAMSGEAVSFSEADLAATAAAYDPAVHEAPIVIGHPAHDLPAYGWVKSLTTGPDGLHAEPIQVDPAFAELHEAGRFKKISASFYPPNSPNNPKPGVYYLRHVGFLGAQPPAVKGLLNSSFADDGADLVTIEFGEEPPAGILGRAVELLAQAVKGIQGQPAPVSTAPAVPPTTTPPTKNPEKEEEMSKELQEQLAAAQAQAAKAEADNATLKSQMAAFAEQQKKAVHATNTAFAETQAQAGRLLPKDKASLVAVLDQLNAGGPVEFGEGDDKKNVDPAEWLKGFISNAPTQVQFGEHKGGKAPAGSVNVNASDKDIHAAAVAYQAQHNVSYSEALEKVVTT